MENDYASVQRILSFLFCCEHDWESSVQNVQHEHVLEQAAIVPIPSALSTGSSKKQKSVRFNLDSKNNNSTAEEMNRDITAIESKALTELSACDPAVLLGWQVHFFLLQGSKNSLFMISLD